MFGWSKNTFRYAGNGFRNDPAFDESHSFERLNGHKGNSATDARLKDYLRNGRRGWINEEWIESDRANDTTIK